MDDERSTIDAEYHNNDIVVTSTDPLIGVLKLGAANDETVELVLNRDSAVALLAAVARFLTSEEGIGESVKNSLQ